MRRKELDRVQDLIGRAISIYKNDRSSNRADLIIPVLEEAFNLILDLRDTKPKKKRTTPNDKDAP